MLFSLHLYDSIENSYSVDSMRSAWFWKKAFLYFGGAFILLLGGAIVVMAPYNYMGYVAPEGDVYPFKIRDDPGYYPQLEFGLGASPDNETIIYVDVRIVNNETHNVIIRNYTLDERYRLTGVSNIRYEMKDVISLEYGNYTIYIDRLEGITWIDVSLKQLTNSRTYIIIGGSMNILGLVMGIIGYCMPGTMIETDDEQRIIQWGYDKEIGESDE